MRNDLRTDDLRQVQPGWDVIDLHGEKIGGVKDGQPDYLVLTKGLIFLKDLYVPLDAIDAVNVADQTVTLNVTKSGIDEAAWSQAPSAGSNAAVFTEDSPNDTRLSTDDATRLREGYARDSEGFIRREDDDDLAGQAGGAAAGAVGGAAVGAAVGGPPGAVVGGAIGAVGGAVAGDAVEDEVEGDDPR
jgi:outer membrane protein with glycine zipper